MFAQFRQMHVVIQMIFVGGLSCLVCGAVLFAVTAGELGWVMLLVGVALLLVAWADHRRALRRGPKAS